MIAPLVLGSLLTWLPPTPLPAQVDSFVFDGKNDSRLRCAITPGLVQQPSRFATFVDLYLPGGGPGIFADENILGGPQGEGFGMGSLDVTSLGVGGSIALGFEATILDGPGADFIVYENSILAGSGAFSEAMFVEVSTDGVHYARFPTYYTGPNEPQAPLGVVPIGSYRGFAGVLPVLANTSTNNIDPFDPVESGGTAFDLADLLLDPLVKLGLVGLEKIHHVRLVDVIAGIDLDSRVNVIYDNGAPGSPDVDAVGVIQHTANQSPCGPTVDFYIDCNGYAHLILADPEGLVDLDFATLSVSMNLIPLPFVDLELNGWFELWNSDAFHQHWITPTPVAGSGLMGALSVSVKDSRGAFSGDQLYLEG